MIAGIEAHTRFYSEMAIEKARAKRRELYRIEGATHVDLYDKEQYVDRVVEKMNSFFTITGQTPELERC